MTTFHRVPQTLLDEGKRLGIPVIGVAPSLIDDGFIQQEIARATSKRNAARSAKRTPPVAYFALLQRPAAAAPTSVAPPTTTLGDVARASRAVSSAATATPVTLAATPRTLRR